MSEAGIVASQEATGAVVTHQRSLAPRAGYNPGDPVMSVITCQL